MKFKMILLLAGLLSTYMYASCNKQEVIKLIDKGFSKAEINSICDIQAKSTAKRKPKSKWITPSNSTCRAKGGKLYKGICQAKYKQAKNICRASGGRLATLNELTQVIKECGGVVANRHLDGVKMFSEKAEENIGDTNYQSCCKQKGFSGNATEGYWSSTAYIGHSIDTWGVFFIGGAQNTLNKNGGLYVRCVRAGQ